MMKTLKIFNLVFFLLMIAVNALANFLPLGHGNTGAISAKYPALFTPAPVTFSIWGVIYLLLAVFCIFQFGILGGRDLAERFVSLAGPWFIISCVLNICWLFCWHYELTALSFISMLGILFSLIIITLRVTEASLLQTTNTKMMPFFARISMIAFDIYIGWITAATIANICALLAKNGWKHMVLSEEYWTVIFILAGAVLGIIFILSREKYMSAAAIIWAYCGILIKHISPSGYGGSYPLIIAVSFMSIAAILVIGIITMIFHLGSSD